MEIKWTDNDPETGERIPFDPPSEPPEKSAPPDRPPAADPAAVPATAPAQTVEGARSPIVVWIAGGAVAAGLLLWVIVSRFKRS